MIIGKTSEDYKQIKCDIIVCLLQLKVLNGRRVRKSCFVIMMCIQTQFYFYSIFSDDVYLSTLQYNMHSNKKEVYDVYLGLVFILLLFY